MSGLSGSSKEIVKDMTEAQAKPNVILAAITEKFPEDNATAKHVYNYLSKMRKESFEDRKSVV